MFINSSSFKNTGFQYYDGLHWHTDSIKDFFDNVGDSLNENLIHMKVVLILVIIIVNSPLLRQVQINEVKLKFKV